jgi:hypothetical protein
VLAGLIWLRMLTGGRGGTSGFINGREFPDQVRGSSCVKDSSPWSYFVALTSSNSVAPESQGSSPCSQEPVPILSQLNPLQPISPRYILIPSTPRSSEWFSFLQAFTSKPCVLLFHTCHMARPRHSPSLNRLIIFGDEF